MATIDSKELITKIIENDGYYHGDPRVFQIVEYINAYGNTTWGVTWSNEPQDRQRRYEIPSHYVNSPRVIWRAND